MPLIEELLAEHKKVDKRYRRTKGRWKSDAEEFRIKSLSKIFQEGTRINETTFDFPFHPEIFDGSNHKDSYGFNKDTGSLISTPGFLFLIDEAENYIGVNDETLQDQSIQKIRYTLDTAIIKLNQNFEWSIKKLHKLAQMLTKKDQTRIGYCGKEWLELTNRPYHVRLLESVQEIMVNGERINDNTFFYDGPRCLFIPYENIRNRSLEIDYCEIKYFGDICYPGSGKVELSCKGVRIPLRELNNCYKDMDGIVITVDTKKVDVFRSQSFLKQLRRYDRILSGKETGAITYSTKCPWSSK